MSGRQWELLSTEGPLVSESDEGRDAACLVSRRLSFLEARPSPACLDALKSSGLLDFCKSGCRLDARNLSSSLLSALAPLG